MTRCWDLWIKGIMVLAICPAMHFGLLGFGAVTGVPASEDIRLAWNYEYDEESADENPEDLGERFPDFLTEDTAEDDDSNPGVH